MPFTYTGDPAGVPLDAVRFRLGDHQAGKMVLTDAEITYLLSLHDGDPLGAAIDGAGTLTARYAEMVDHSEGDISKSYSQRAKAYSELRKALRQEADAATDAGEGAPGIPFAGGLRYSALPTDSDLIPAYFYEGMSTGAPPEDREHCR